MSRIQPLDPNTVQGEAKELLEKIKAKTGRLSNIMKTMAHAPVALKAFMGMHGALADAKLSLKVREQISLAVGEDNQCHYCVAAHSAIGKHAGLTPEEIEGGRRARSADPKTNAILGFAKKLSANRGNITDQDFADAQKAGCSDEEILEVVTAVAMNLFTNYINHVADTALDFPAAPPLS